jgi:hypothetical protein
LENTGTIRLHRVDGFSFFILRGDGGTDNACAGGIYNAAGHSGRHVLAPRVGEKSKARDH